MVLSYPTSQNADALIALLDMKKIFPLEKPEPQELLSPPNITENGETKPRRPINAFFIFRQNVIPEAKRVGVTNMQLISKVASILWKKAPESDKQNYRNLAAEVSVLHRRKYPSFRYAQVRSSFSFRRQGFSRPFSQPPNTNNTPSSQTSNPLSSPNFNENAFSNTHFAPITINQSSYSSFIDQSLGNVNVNLNLRDTTFLGIPLDVVGLDVYPLFFNGNQY
ncbi:7647_t:CDS:1 [Ambispora gerdemannii]|uniref:7647_t:CDS:1 n=1 Tax=Ambispora gerdemannii TaxID=144530 RepID=A0A9N9CV84_9GLOM|nr:7647_t:CDS:1 [Ambispora gerdemannii]